MENNSRQPEFFPMRFLPVFLDLARGHVVLVGSGPQASAKLHLLRAAGAHVRWFSPQPDRAEQSSLAEHYAGDIDVASGEIGRASCRERVFVGV